MCGTEPVNVKAAQGRFYAFQQFPVTIDRFGTKLGFCIVFHPEVAEVRKLDFLLCALPCPHPFFKQFCLVAGFPLCFLFSHSGGYFPCHRPFNLPPGLIVAVIAADEVGIASFLLQ